MRENLSPNEKEEQALSRSSNRKSVGLQESEDLQEVSDLMREQFALESGRVKLLKSVQDQIEGIKLIVKRLNSEKGK
jgi:hypothetical protein